MSELINQRVLLVEDSPVVSLDTEEMLREWGCIVLGPATNMAAALQLSDEELDGAIVDINIRGGKAFPLLKILDNRAVPFLLTSGYADWSMPAEWRDRPRLTKPYTASALRQSLLDLLTNSAGR